MDLNLIGIWSLWDSMTLDAGVHHFLGSIRVIWVVLQIRVPHFRSPI